MLRTPMIAVVLSSALMLSGCSPPDGASDADTGSEEDAAMADAADSNDGGTPDLRADVATPEVCAPLTASRDECESQPTCVFVPADERARLEDEMCVSPSENLCLSVPRGGNSDIVTCAYRTQDGITEAMVWDTGTTPPGWDGAFEQVPEVCKCLDEF